MQRSLSVNKKTEDVPLSEQLSFKQSKYLVERTGLGSELNRIKKFEKKPIDFALSQLFFQSTKSKVAPPVLLNPLEMRKTKKAFRESGNRKKSNQLYKKERVQLTNWGLQNLLKSDNALHERMVWFWHNHFTSSIKSVRTAQWMLDQDLLIRNHALGNFADFLSAMTFEPAMLIYLDGKSNIKGQPNENFARELLELFTLGEGHYTEDDIKEAARAFTGWKVDIKKGKAVFRKKLHDAGKKSFMGKTGQFTGEDILQILLKNPRTAEFICEKLWYEFVSIQKPEKAAIKLWAKGFQASNYDISELLKTLFKSPEFWDKKYRGTLIKSPIDLVVGTLRTFDLEDGDIPLLALNKQLKRLGQELYAPPNVKGWVGGKGWIDDVTLPIRQRFLQRLLRGQVGINKKKKMSKGMNNKEGGMMANDMNKEEKNQPMEMTLPNLPELPDQQWSEWLLPIIAVSNITTNNKRNKLKALVLDPAYQLK